MLVFFRRFAYFFFFAVVVAMVILYAAGYRWYHQKLVKTSIIAFVSYASQVQLFFDDVLVADALPFQITSVLPGMHKVRIEKNGYTTWQKAVTVDEDTVTRIDHVLFVPTTLSWRTILEDASKTILNPLKEHMAVLSDTSKIISFLQLGDETDTFLRSYNLFSGVVVRAEWVSDDLFFVLFEDGTFQQFDLAEHAVVTASVSRDLFNLLQKASFNDGIFVHAADGVLKEMAFVDGAWDFQAVPLPSWAQTIDDFSVTPFFFYIQKGAALWQIGRIDETMILLPIVATDDSSWEVWDRVLFNTAENRLVWFDQNQEVHFVTTSGRVDHLVFTPEGTSFLFSVAGDVFLVDPTVSLTPVFVTRFSHVIDDLAWYDDPFHFLVLEDHTLTLCEQDGGNCTIVDQNVQNFAVAPDYYTVFVYTAQSVIQAFTLTLEKGFLSF